MKQRRKRNLIACGLGCVLLFGLIWLAARQRDEPAWKGRTLSRWLLVYSDPTADAPRAEAEDAVRKIGVRALPSLVDWIQFEPMRPEWRHTLGRQLGKMPLRPITSPMQKWLWRETASERAHLAEVAFGILGPEAAPAAEELCLVASDPGNRFSAARATSALAQIGIAGLPQLLTVLTNPAATTRDIALCGIGELEGEAIPAVPALIACLDDKNTVIAGMAANILGELSLEPAKVVPALDRALRGTNDQMRAQAASALEQYGSKARSAAPELLEALGDRDPMVRNAATNALEKIAPELLAKKGL